MSDGVQPGTTVDADLWERFREEVRRRRGGVRGHLRTELETALNAYIQGGEPTPSEIEARLQRIEAAVGAASADGGTDTFDAEIHTHAPELTVDEKPPANAATEKKVAYLAACVRDEYGETFGSIKRAELIEIVKTEYGFRSDTARRYVDQLIEHFDLREHIKTDEILVTQEEYEKMVEFEKEEARREAEETLDAI